MRSFGWLDGEARSVRGCASGGGARARGGRSADSFCRRSQSGFASRLEQGGSTQPPRLPPSCSVSARRSPIPPPPVELAGGGRLEIAEAVREWIEGIAIQSVWNDAALAILDGELDRAAELFVRIGSMPDEARARLRSVGGRRAEADEHRALAGFWRSSTRPATSRRARPSRDDRMSALPILRIQETPAGFPRCANCGVPLAAAPATTREERKVVTCLFCDLVGFTARAERMDPEDVRRLLQPYHARVRGELERFGGTVEKFIGDAVMAVFGAPIAHEDDPERAVRAALRSGTRSPRKASSMSDRDHDRRGTDRAGRAPRGRRGHGVGRRREHRRSAPVGRPDYGILVDETTHRATERHRVRRAARRSRPRANPRPSWPGRRCERRTRVGAERLGGRSSLAASASSSPPRNRSPANSSSARRACHAGRSTREVEPPRPELFETIPVRETSDRRGATADRSLTARA